MSDEPESLLGGRRFTPGVDSFPAPAPGTPAPRAPQALCGPPAAPVNVELLQRAYAFITSLPLEIRLQADFPLGDWAVLVMELTDELHPPP